MDREEAIKVLVKNKPTIIFEDEEAQKRMADLCNAIDTAIEALSAEQTDLISRDEVHKILSLLATEGGPDAKMLLADAHEFIDALPSADIPTKLIAKININADEVVRKIKDEYEIADRPSGEWIFNGDGKEQRKSWFICDQCGQSLFHKTNYCPNCGAKMEGNK